MLKPLAPLALLALAAAASAQTVNLSLVGLSGFNQSGTVYSYTGYPSPDLLPAKLQSALNTKHTRYSSFHTAWGSDGSRRTQYYTFQNRQGWLAEFALPAAPAGMAVAFAILTADATGALDQPLSVGAYVGDGRVTPSDAPGPGSRNVFVGYVNSLPGAGRRSADLTGLIQALLDRGAGYAGVTVDRRSYQNVSSGGDELAWSNPSLTLTYGYRVRLPVVLGDNALGYTNYTLPLEVRRPGTREVVSSRTFVTNGASVVDLALPPGEWDVSFKAFHWLRRTIRVRVTDGPVDLPTQTLVNGDVNGDNVVSAIDRARVTAALGTQYGGAGYDPAADVSSDRVINAADRAIVTLRLGSVGDE